MKHTISDLLIQRFHKKPLLNAIGWIDKDSVKTLSFKAYKENIEALSLALLDLGLALQNKVSIISRTRYEWHLFDMAIMSAGGVTVPIYPSYAQKEINFIVNHSESEIVVIEGEEQLEKIISHQNQFASVKKLICMEKTSSALEELLPSGIKLFFYEDLLEQGHASRVLNPDLFENNIQNVNPEHTATIVYTSGTTGQPKGAVIQHQAVFQVLKNLEKYSQQAITEKDRLLTYLPLSHVLGRLESFTTILFGNETIYIENTDQLFTHMAMVKPTLLVTVPRVLEKVYEKSKIHIETDQIKRHTFKWAMKVANLFYEVLEQNETPSSALLIQYSLAKKFVFNRIYHLFGGRIRYFISGGAPLDMQTLKFLRNAELTVLEGYGLTETIAPCIISPLRKQVLGTVGQPIGDVRIKFRDDGEILIKSKALFSGYFKDEKETARVFDDEGWFCTGDIGEFDSQGFLKITGRKKDFIITSGGKNIAPQKLENLLRRSLYISHAVILGDKRKFLTALIAISKEALAKFFDQFEIEEDCDYIELATHPKITDLIQKEIAVCNEDLASFETIKDFRIIPQAVSQENYLTPSLKLKRKELKRDHKSLCDAMYK